MVHEKRNNKHRFQHLAISFFSGPERCIKHTAVTIVGGTFGSVGSLALVAFPAVFCLTRHRHRRSLREPVAALNDDHEFQMAEMADDPLKEIEGKPRYSF